ncbi:hypothetical protein D3C80_498500 [compost metagenome]
MRFNLLLLLAFFSSQVFAVDYFWSVHSSAGSAGTSGPASPEGLCTATKNAILAGDPTYSSVQDDGSYYFSATRYRCLFKLKKSNGVLSSQRSTDFWRHGTQCPSGQTIPPGGYVCEGLSNPCDSKKFQSGELVTDSLELELCDGQCGFAVEYIDSYMPDGKLTLLAKGKWTGEQCATDQTTDDLDPENLPPLVETKTENKCEETTTDAEGRTVSKCKFTKETLDAQTCVMRGGKLGTVNDVIKCVQGNKGPQYDKEVVDTTTKEKTNIDGSKDKTTTTDTAKTSCIGVKACSTTNTNVTKNESTKADGTPGDSDESCSGPGCTGDDGKGEEGEDEGEAPSYSVGALEKPTKLGTSNFGLDDWDNKIDQVKGDIEDARELLTNAFDGVTDVSLGGAAGELPCTAFSWRGENYEICVRDFEPQLIQIGNAIFLCACLLAAFIVFAPKGGN